ncbi:MAG: hypothetical protein E7307_10585 [Butyrivibrio sp.]|nr:hypothetical protein [Butyrivibrio sp.]
MKKMKKNRFFTFMFSFLPGAAEMYMGFMKNGFTLMLIFFLSFSPIVIAGGLDFLIPLTAVVWFYGFFHARNYAALDDQSIAEMEDRYVWEEFSDIKWNGLSNKTVKKWVAAILIIIGAAQLWDYFSDMVYRMIPGDYWEDIYPFVSNIPQVVISILLVVIGVRMIIGKKKELDAPSEAEEKPAADIAQIEDKSLNSKEA